MRFCPICRRRFGQGLASCPEDGVPLLEDREDPLVGSVVNGRYRLEELLGEGQMSKIYRAVQLDLERPVALKLLAPAFWESDEVAGRFVKEAKAIAEIQHENIVQVFDFGRTREGRLFMAMELLEGSSLDRTLAESEPFGALRAISVARQAGLALEASHRRGIVHRDLKPANIFLLQSERRERVKVLDFGLAKFLYRTPGEEAEETEIGTVLGTPQYMAPEQCQGNPTIDGRADLYALGVILYEMLTGRVPFAEGGPLEIIGQHLWADPVAPRQVCAEIPDELEAIILHALAKDRMRRVQTARQFVESLDRVQQVILRQGEEPPPSSTARRRRADEPTAGVPRAPAPAAPASEPGQVNVRAETGRGRRSATRKIVALQSPPEEQAEDADGEVEEPTISEVSGSEVGLEVLEELEEVLEEERTSPAGDQTAVEVRTPTAFEEAETILTGLAPDRFPDEAFETTVEERQAVHVERREAAAARKRKTDEAKTRLIDLPRVRKQDKDAE